MTSDAPATSLDAAARVGAAVQSVIVGKPATVHLALTVLLAGGHLLVEDVPGVGKTMLAKNIAHKAILAGKTAWFRSAAQILNELQTKDTFRSANLGAQRYGKPDLLVIDELGYLSYETRAADILFQLIQSRYEAKSIIVTMNVAFADWNSVFPSAACVSAMIDRLTHHATILSFSGESYRLKESGEQQSKRKINTKKAAKK